MTEPAKKTPAKRAPRVKAEAPQPESVEAKANEALEGMGWPAPTTEQWAEATGVMSRPYPSVHELWSRVMESVRSVAKGDFNEDQGFKFRGVDAVVDAVGPALRAHKVYIRPRRILEQSATEYQSKRGARMVNRVVHVEWEVTGPQGDSFLGESMGEAADMGDKSLSKAQSVAYRTYLLQALAIPTGDRDPDSDAHERATPAGPEGYYWDQQQGRNVAPGAVQPQQQATYASREEARQAQAGEENQAAQVDNEEARSEMWRKAKSLGWKWENLTRRFQSDYGMETGQADKQTLVAFTKLLVAEAKEQEEQAKTLAGDLLGAKPIDEAQTTGGVL